MTHSIESKTLSFVEKFTPTLSSVTYLKRILVDRTRQIWHGKYSESTERKFGTILTKTARGIAMISHLGIRIPVALGITFPAIIGTYEAVTSNILNFAHGSEYPAKIHEFVNYTYFTMGLELNSYVASALTNLGIGKEAIDSLIGNTVFVPFKVNYFVFNVLTNTHNYLGNISGNPIFGVDIPQMINSGLDIVRAATLPDKSLIASVGVMVLFQIVTSRPMRHKLINATPTQSDGTNESHARITHPDFEAIKTKFALTCSLPLQEAELVTQLDAMTTEAISLVGKNGIPNAEIKALFVKFLDKAPVGNQVLRDKMIAEIYKLV